MKKKNIILIISVAMLFVISCENSSKKEKQEDAINVDKNSTSYLLEQVKTNNNNNEKIKIYSQILKMIGDNPDYRTICEYGDAMISLIKVYIEQDANITIEKLLDIIKIKEGYGRKIIKTDINNDGIDECFVMAGESNIALMTNHGKLSYLDFSTTLEITKLLKTYTNDKTKNKYLLFRYDGGLGSGCDFCDLIAVKNGRLQKIFTSPKSHFNGCEVKDINNDKKEEFICYEEILYKYLYWPRIYNWNGENLYETTYNYPDFLINYYKNMNTETKDRADTFLKNKSKETSSFYGKYLKPMGNK